MSSNVGSSSFTSCLWAPATTNDSGIPLPSTNRLRLVPFFPPIRRTRSDGLQRQRSLHHCPIDTLPAPSNPFHLVVFCKPFAPQTHKNPLAFPVQEVFMDGTRTTEHFFGEGFPLASGPKDIYDSFKDLTGIHGLAASTWSSQILLSFLSLLRWDQRLNPFPKRIRHCP